MVNPAPAAKFKLACAAIVKIVVDPIKTERLPD